MLDPLGLDVEWERRPWGVLGLVSVMAAVLFTTMRAEPESLEPLLLQPGELRPWQFVTSTFLHADPWHLLFNALYLWVFGRYVEEGVGPVRFLVLFLVFGAVGDLVYLWKGPSLPSLGSSGAVAGLMGLVLFTAPRVGVRVTVGWMHRGGWRVPAWLFLGLWLGQQLLAVHRETDEGIAYTAHLGGFLAGCLASWILRSPLARRTGWHLARAPEGGAAHAASYRELVASENAWRVIYENSRRARGTPESPQTSAAPPKPEAPETPRVFDITPRGGAPAAGPTRPAPRDRP